MNTRLKEIRKTLGLTQSDFASILNMSRITIAQMENGARNITDRTIKDICREFKVDYIWLTTGKGDMFINSETDILATIENIMTGEDEFYKNVVKMIVNLDPDDIKTLKKIAFAMIERQKKTE